MDTKDALMLNPTVSLLRNRLIIYIYTVAHNFVIPLVIKIKFIYSLFFIHFFYKKSVCIEMNVQPCRKMSGSENEALENDLHVELQAQQEE